MADTPGIDYLVGKRIWSESVYADCVTADGAAGLMVRLCRYPTEKIAWLWAFAFLPDKIYGYNDHYLPCTEEVTEVEKADISYEQRQGASAVFHRKGPRDNPDGATVSLEVRAHQAPDVPHGQGSVPLNIEMQLKPYRRPWRLNRYRSEWVAEVEAIFWADKSRFEVKGFGHWHEQHQKAPRFMVPFTYISLRGKDLALIASSTEGDDRGHVISGAEPIKINEIEIDPPADQRAISLTLKDESKLAGTIITVHRYSVPIYNRRRPGTLVTAQIGGYHLSGCVNDWLID
ncbi:MAG TPA: hypothetical protein ENH70_10020 [Desulfobacteraceae bacterium]|nr:hypothetical protein [Desulfobacteraceae bacterium]